ncbi:MAG: Gfo/Idh/MocA family oxidoreductase [Phycisphaeraceae bacterium]
MSEDSKGAAVAVTGKGESWEPLPPIDLRQLLRMTDDTGLMQHAVHATPDSRHGYCIDDNARGLIAALYYAQLRGYDERVVPLQRYLQFLVYAFNEETRRFRNFMGYDRRWLEDVGSADSQGRTIWALGLAVSLAPNKTVRSLARELMHKALPGVEQLAPLRARCFALLGLDAFLKAEPHDAYARKLRDHLANWLYETFKERAGDNWPWWEDTVTYDNAKVPHALLVCGQAMARQDMIDAALRALRWLLVVQTAPQGHLSIIGNHGWLRRDGQRAQFDQQPIEAWALVEGCLAAAKVSAEADWVDHAWRCFAWFRGRNDLGISLYHEETGGCQDGLQADGANVNQGAESVLAYLLSVLELHRYREDRAGRIAIDPPPRTLGYAIIGASGFADFCLKQYGGLDRLEPVAVWSRTVEHARGFADRWKLRACAQLDDMLEDPQVQLVHVATTPATHANLALEALRRGKHVLVEKPLATSVVDAQEMIQAAKQRDRTLSVHFVMRYGPLAEAMKKIVGQGALGAPLRGMVTNCAGDAGLPADHWFWDIKQSGGIFIEHGVHFFDLLRSWLGEGQVIYAHRQRRPGGGDRPTSHDPELQASNGRVVDQVTCDVAYGPQTSVSFYHGFHQSPHMDRQDVRLIFERGEVVLEGWIARKIRVRAVLDEEQIDAVAAALPQAPAPKVQTLRELRGGDAVAQRRWRREPVSREVLITWESDADASAVYGQAVRAFMADMLAGIVDHQHHPRVTARDGLTALELATEAARMARELTR